MTPMALRLIAVAIAVAGLVDPAFTTARRGRPPIAVVVQDGPTMELPTADGSSRRAVAERVRARLEKDLGSAYRIQPAPTSDAAAAIVIGDRYQNTPMERASVSTVTVASDIAPNVRIVAVDAPLEVPVATAIRVAVDVEGIGVAGKTTRVSAQIAGLEVGDASHEWKGGRERWRALIDAVPVGEPPFALRVEVQPLDVERTSLDNIVDTAVGARREPFRVHIYETRPSWATVFARRALEADARFNVAGVTTTSRGTATRTADPVAFTDPALESVDVVIVGGLEKLTAAEARTLERFMRERGGAVVLMPDARMTAGPALDLLGRVTLEERLSDRPERLTVTPPLQPIQGSELLLMRGDVPIASERVAWTSARDSTAVAFSMPRGNGRLFFSGVLDAWRFRADDGGAFDRFWQSTIAGLALAAVPPISVATEPRILRPGERGEVVVRVRSAADDPAQAGRHRSVRAEIDGQPIRLWPRAENGVFRGSFDARETAGRSTLVAHVEGESPLSASRTLVIRGDAWYTLPQFAPPLSMLASSHHGIDAAPENVSAVERHIRSSIVAPSETQIRHPMRSGWWIVPFAACLSAEWWFRRRRGLR